MRRNFKKFNKAGAMLTAMTVLLTATSVPAFADEADRADTKIGSEASTHDANTENSDATGIAIVAAPEDENGTEEESSDNQAESASDKEEAHESVAKNNTDEALRPEPRSSAPAPVNSNVVDASNGGIQGKEAEKLLKEVRNQPVEPGNDEDVEEEEEAEQAERMYYELHIKIDGSFKDAVQGQKDYKNGDVNVYYAVKDLREENAAELEWKSVEGADIESIDAYFRPVDNGADPDTGMELRVDSGKLILTGIPKKPGNYLVYVTGSSTKWNEGISNELPFLIKPAEKSQPEEKRENDTLVSDNKKQDAESKGKTDSSKGTNKTEDAGKADKSKSDSKTSSNKAKSGNGSSRSSSSSGSKGSSGSVGGYKSVRTLGSSGSAQGPSMLQDSFSGAVWEKTSDSWLLKKADGTHANGWVVDKGIWYYLREGDGIMLTGWQLINDKWYYLAESGALLISTVTPDGYTVDASGAWTGK